MHTKLSYDHNKYKLQFLLCTNTNIFFLLIVIFNKYANTITKIMTDCAKNDNRFDWCYIALHIDLIFAFRVKDTQCTPQRHIMYASKIQRYDKPKELTVCSYWLNEQVLAGSWFMCKCWWYHLLSQLNISNPGLVAWHTLFAKVKDKSVWLSSSLLGIFFSLSALW